MGNNLHNVLIFVEPSATRSHFQAKQDPGVTASVEILFESSSSINDNEVKERIETDGFTFTGRINYYIDTL